MPSPHGVGENITERSSQQKGKMLEIEKISESQFEKIRDLDSLDLLNARNVPATTTAIITPMIP